MRKFTKSDGGTENKQARVKKTDNIADCSAASDLLSKVTHEIS